MRRMISTAAACLLLAACGKGHDQADALDRAAAQSDPAAAAELHNRADAIRDGGFDANMADPNSPAQAALANAGAAAARDPHASPQGAAAPLDNTTGLTR